MGEAAFCPAGRTLYAAGAKGKFKVSSSNCYILPSPEDNIESIFKVNAQIARIFSYGGGIGVNISHLRPKGSIVRNAARTSTGAVSFLKIFDSTGEVISQNGRRGAMMIGLDCDHPDLYEFLRMKQNNERLASMNISILFTDAFMSAVRDDKDFTLHFDVEATGEHIERSIRARDFFLEFCRTQWDWGDPGALFKDRLNQYTLLSGYEEYKIEITNPCGEFGGNAYNSCNLASLNLYKIVKDPFGDHPDIDWSKLGQMTEDGVQALDEIMGYGYSMQPLAENKTCIDEWRSIGLGLFGVADAMTALKITYGSDASCRLMNRVMKVMMTHALRASCRLAKEKGTFGKYDWEKTKCSPIIEKIRLEDPGLYEEIHTYGLRNGTLLSVAPTGSISLLMGCWSGGCEPLYKVSYERSTHKMELERKSFRVYAHSIEDLLEYHHLPSDLSDEEIRNRFPWVIESHDVPFLNRVRLQAAMQEWVDNSISSTVNLKAEATPEEIYQLYLAAWESGCKGITVFRDGCRRGNILGVQEKQENTAKEQEAAETKAASQGHAAEICEQTHQTGKGVPKSGSAVNSKCPRCGEYALQPDGHCVVCTNCGWGGCAL